MTVVIDSREHAAAIKAAVNVQLGDDVECYEYDEVPGVNGNDGTEPRKYAVFSIERRYNPNLRAAKAGGTGWRVAARCNGMTVDESRWVMFKTAAALNETVLTIDGSPTTRLQFEADQAPEFDDGRYSGLALYTYSH